MLRIAHLSDTHLGYEAYRAVTGDGHNQRGQDLVDAWLAACDAIDAWDPDLVVHSGDIIDRPQVPVRYLLAVRAGLARLAAVRPDGTRRRVVVIAGNHDAPHNLGEAAALELFADLPGVTVAARDVTWCTFGDGADTPAALTGVAVCAVPHDALLALARSDGWDRIRPSDAPRNVLVTHGIVGGSSLYKRGIGREYAIPAATTGAGWDYVALGHWHRRGPVDADGRVWYAGSTENCGFGDLADSGERRGWVAVEITDTAAPTVTVHDVAIRPMRYLPTIDATGLDAAEVTGRLVANAADGDVTGHVVAQVVVGAARDVWSLVDAAAAHRAASAATHYQIVVRPTGDTDRPVIAAASGGADADSAVAAALAALPETRRDAAATVTGRLLAQVRHRALTGGRSGTGTRPGTVDPDPGEHTREPGAPTTDEPADRHPAEHEPADGDPTPISPVGGAR